MTMSDIARRLLAVLFVFYTSQVLAQVYPSKPVTIIVPYAAGGATDISARLMARALSDALGQSFVVENKPGAGGLIGDEQAARSKPDGYTLLVASTGPATISPLLYKDHNFDPLARLDPVILFAQTPAILLVRNSLSVKSVKDLIALSREKPGALNVASAGVGSLQHLLGEVFQTKQGVKWTHIPYNGSAPMLTAMIADRVDVMVDLVVSAAPMVKAGKITALAVLTPKRSSQLPDVPTLAELGYSGYDYSGWQALLAPKGTPPAVIAKLNAVINKALMAPEMKAQLAKMGSDPIGGDPQVLGKRMSDEIQEWTRVIQAGHISVSR